MIGQIVMLLSGCLIGVGILVFTSFPKQQTVDVLRHKMTHALRKRVRSDEENILKGTGYYISIQTYNLVRLGAAAFLIAMGAALSEPACIGCAVLFYLLSWPRSVISGIKMPYFYFVQAFITVDRENKDTELMEALSLLKNLMVQMQNNPVGADYMIDYIASGTKLTKPAYLKLLNQLRLNNLQAAEETFVAEIGTELSKTMARILVQINDINPKHFEEILISAQQQVREIRTTRKQLRDERLSDLAMIPILATVMLVFINFICVAYFIDLSSSLGGLF